MRGLRGLTGTEGGWPFIRTHSATTERNAAQMSSIGASACMWLAQVVQLMSPSFTSLFLILCWMVSQYRLESH